MFLKRVRGPHIVQVTSCSSGDFLFVFGLGSDGAMYIWNAVQATWLLHKQAAPEAAAEPPKAK